MNLCLFSSWLLKSIYFCISFSRLCVNSVYRHGFTVQRPVLLCFLKQQGRIARLCTSLGLISCQYLLQRSSFLLEIGQDCTPAPALALPAYAPIVHPDSPPTASAWAPQCRWGLSNRLWSSRIRPCSTRNSEWRKGFSGLLLRVVQNQTKENPTMDLVSLHGACFPRASFLGESMLKGLQITACEWF